MAKSSRPRHSRRKREPATIDLEAESVERESEQDGQEPAEESSAAETADSESRPGAEDDAGAQVTEDQRLQGESEPGRDRETADEEDVSAPDEKSDETHEAPTAEGGETPPQEEEERGAGAPPPSGGSGRAFVAGIAGGIIVLLLAAGLQWANVLPALNDSEPDPAVEDLRQELASVQDSLGQLSQAQRDAATDEQFAQLESQLGELRETVSQLEASAQEGGAQAGDELEERISQIETAVENATQTTASAQQSAATNAQRLDGIADQVGQLDQRLSEQDQGPQLRLVVAAMALESAVESGASFASQLETYTALAPDASAVEPLRQYADEGLPSDAALAGEASQVASRITNRASDDPQEEEGLLDRLLAGARTAVQVRPVGQTQGDSAQAVAARMEAAVQDGDYAQALTEYEALPPEAQEISAGLAEKLRARLAADQIVEEALSSALQPV